MKSIFLFPYCPLPADSGAKTEALKVLNVLGEMGECTVFSAASKPVGTDWPEQIQNRLRGQGFGLVLREDLQKRRNFLQWLGILYGAVFKAFGQERLFGHANPYHRYAFPGKIWKSCSSQFDIAVINYSYWAWLPTSCPKVVILHDLLSETMRAGTNRETRDLRTASLVVVISCDEEKTLNRNGIRNTLWSPPAVKFLDVSVPGKIGIVGSANRFNREGLGWLNTAIDASSPPISVYGGLAEFASRAHFTTVDRYEDSMEPYRECGIILIPTGRGTGVQIKAIEALAAGRAIIARRGAMRGIPHSGEAWVEVESPAEMIECARLLTRETGERERLGRAAHAYYRDNLDADKIRMNLKNALKRVYDDNLLS